MRIASTLRAVLLLVVAHTVPAAAIEAVQFDMTSVFNRDGIWSTAVGDQPGDGFDEWGNCLIEDGYMNWPGLPSNRRVGDFQLGPFDDPNMLAVVHGSGDTVLDLLGTGQAGKFEKLSFLTGNGDGAYGTDLDQLAVRLLYDDGSWEIFLLPSQDWWLEDPPRIPPAPLTVATKWMCRSDGDPNFVLFAFDSDQVDQAKTLTKIVFAEGHPRSTVGDQWTANRFNILAITGYPYIPPVFFQRTENRVAISWEPFGGGQYTVQWTDDLFSGAWHSVPGTWPSTETSWPGEDISALNGRYYRVMSE